MRLETIINESSGKTSLQEILNILWDKCNPFLKDLLSKSKFGGDFLYSGRHETKDYYERNVRKDRTPKDMDEDVHTELDGIFKQKFGWKPRSNSIFVSGDVSTASKYGDSIYMIFPVNKYRYLWSLKVEDLYVTIDGGIDNYYEFIEEFEMHHEEEMTEDLSNEYEREYSESNNKGRYEYTSFELPVLHSEYNVSKEKAQQYFESEIQRYNDLTSGGSDKYMDEMVFDPDSMEWEPEVSFEDYIYDFRHDYWIEREEKGDIKNEWLLELAEKFDDYIGSYKTTDINKAIDSQNEIMLNCKSYIAVNDRYDHLMSSYFSTVGYRKPSTELIQGWLDKSGIKTTTKIFEE